MKKFSIFAVVLILMFLADQAVKMWARQAIPNMHGQLPGAWPWPGVFEITLTYNQGIAFGLFKGMAILMTPIAVAIAGGAGWYSLKHPHESYVTHVAMGLLASGALGNLFDRLVHKQVTDMFWFRAIDFPVFNVADACITIATVLLILTWWGDAVRHRHTESSGNQLDPNLSETPLPEKALTETPRAETPLATDE